MKLLLLLTAFALVYSSCTEMQYLTVSGENILKDSSNNLVSENDTLRVQYKFKEQGGRIELTLWNKTNQPLEIDWRKSALILGGKTESYFNPNSIFGGQIQSDTIAGRNKANYPGNPTYITDLKGSISSNEPVQFIPRQSYLTKTLQALLTEPVPNLAERQQTASKETIGSVDYEVVSYKRMAFTNNQSPVSFRSYLTFRIGTGANQQEFSTEHKFFISEIWQSASAPANFPENLMNRGDRFYLAP